MNPRKEVKISVLFTRIGEIDTMNEKFFAEVVIESVWPLEDNSIQTYDSTKHWNPKLFIHNIVKEEKIDTSHVIDHEKGLVREFKTIKAYFWEKLELGNFPIDTQKLSVLIQSKHMINDIILMPSDEKLSSIDHEASDTFIDQQKWHIFKHVKVVRRLDNNNGNYSRRSSLSRGFHCHNNNTVLFANDKCLQPGTDPRKIKASIFCSRRPGYYFFNAYFLIFLITLSSFATFTIPLAQATTRISTTFTLLLTSISFKWVINRSLPSVSYLTSLDAYSILCIFFICSQNLFHTRFLTHGNTATEDNQRALMVYAGVFVAIHVIMFVWMTVGYWQMRRLVHEERAYLQQVDELSQKQTLKGSKLASDEVLLPSQFN